MVEGCPLARSADASLCWGQKRQGGEGATYQWPGQSLARTSGGCCPRSRHLWSFRWRSTFRCPLFPPPAHLPVSYPIADGHAEYCVVLGEGRYIVTLIVVELPLVSPIEHCVELDDVGVRRRARELVSRAIEAEHQLSGSLVFSPVAPPRARRFCRHFWLRCWGWWWRWQLVVAQLGGGTAVGVGGREMIQTRPKQKNCAVFCEEEAEEEWE